MRRSSLHAAAIAFLVGVGARPAGGQRPVDLAPNAPADRPLEFTEEQVFVAVDNISGADPEVRIAGRIWSPVQIVQGYVYRQPYTFDAATLVDWMIARPDGSEEGNEVGKFAERYQPPATCADSGVRWP